MTGPQIGKETIAGKLSLTGKLKLFSIASALLGFLAGMALLVWLGQAYLWWALLLTALLTGTCMHWITRPLNRSLAALEIGLLNFKDEDFSVSLPVTGDPQLRSLAQRFNQSAQVLRQQRQSIYQRELLLDKVIQSSPNVMLLMDDDRRVIYANHAARQLFKQGVSLEGLLLSELVQKIPSPLAEALEQAKDGLFSFSNSNQDDEQAETWHLSTGRFLLNNQYHHLVLLKQMTRELNRQEVAVWKKVIRLISHELNNSLAPISSMVHSGKLLTRELDDTQLNMIFDTIEERTQHLSQFIFGYARFAKLPLPRPTLVDWPKLTNQLAQHYHFNLQGGFPTQPVELDVVQLEQVLLNLLKNAHESGSDTDAITLSIDQTDLLDRQPSVLIMVEDKGAGMSQEVLQQALLPFYSTKLSGSGLGLPLCREIVEAHGGRISLQNRAQGGLSVRVLFPIAIPNATSPAPEHQPELARQMTGGLEDQPAEQR